MTALAIALGIYGHLAAFVLQSKTTRLDDTEWVVFHVACFAAIFFWVSFAQWMFA